MKYQLEEEPLNEKNYRFVGKGTGEVRGVHGVVQFWAIFSIAIYGTA